MLWIVAIIGFIGVTFSFQTSTELKSAHYARVRLQAEMLAESGVARALATLDEDDVAVDNLGETWSNAPEAFSDVPLAGLDEGTFSVVGDPDVEAQTVRFGLVDECGKVNINTATAEVLLALPGMTPEIADAIIDWRDADDTPGPNGAESSYYEALKQPYTCKNERFESVDELLFVRGVTPRILYGEDANRNGLLDPNEDDADETPPDDNRDGVLDQGLYRYLTVWSSVPNVDAEGEQRVFLNAPWQELAQALSAVIDNNQLVGRIVRRRRQGTFESTADLLDVNGMTEEIYASIVDHLTVSQEQDLPGLINPNTAPAAVLLALPGLTEDDVAALTAFREMNPESTDTPLWILQVVGPEKFRGIAGLLTMRSSQFSFEAIGRFADRPVFKRIRVVVDRRESPTRIVYRQDLTGLGVAYRPTEMVGTSGSPFGLQPMGGTSGSPFGLQSRGGTSGSSFGLQPSGGSGTRAPSGRGRGS